jgi:hypothetical protein
MPDRKALTMPTSNGNSKFSPSIAVTKTGDRLIGTHVAVPGLVAASAGSKPVPLAEVGSNLVACLPPSVASAYRERIARTLGEDDYRVVGGELVGPVHDRALAEAQIIVAAALQPCPAATLRAELLRLKLATRRDKDLSAEEHAMQAALYGEVLAEFPEDIVVSVLRDWPRSGKVFWPELGDLCTRCGRLVEERRRLQRALERAAQPWKAAPVEVDEREPWTEERRVEHEAKMAEYWQRMGGRPKPWSLLPAHDIGIENDRPARSVGSVLWGMREVAG